MTVTLKVKTTLGNKEIPLNIDSPILYIKEAIVRVFGYSKDGHYGITSEDADVEVSGWFHDKHTLSYYGIEEGDTIVLLDFGDAV